MIESSAFCTEPSRYFPAKIPSYAAAQARRLCEVEGEVVINERVEQRWFLRFNTGEESTKYLPRSGILKLRDIENIHRVLKGNQQESTRRLSEERDTSEDTKHRQINTLGKSYRSCRSVRHELTPQQAQRIVDVCSQLIGNPMDDRFIRRIVTCDEK